jgi:hypothetical protein
MKVALICIGIAIVAFFVFWPAQMHHHGYRANESAAVGTLRRLVWLENAYAADRPATGYTCDLASLLQKAKGDYGSDMLAKGERSGYRFEAGSCESDEDGIVRQFRLTAVPQEPGLSGVQAFCVDEGGKVFYDAQGSAADCWAARREFGR